VAVVPVLIDCVVLSDHFTLQGAVPVRAAAMVAEVPGQIVVLPLTVAVGVLTVTAALPLPALEHPEASLTDVTVYVVDDDGLTLRVAVVPLLIVWMFPSDQVTLHGAVPVSVAVIVAELPAQIAPPPLTAAFGRGRTVTAAGAEVAEQPLAFVMFTV
jgi:hypothetical protein